jgi:hypothetical protein
MSKAKTLATTVSTGGVLDNPSAIPAANISGAVGSATNLAGGSNGTVPYQSASGTTQMLAVGTAGQVLTSAGAAAPTWSAPAATGVTSVAATVPSIFSITGSPITSTGTLAMTYSGTALPIANGGTGTTSTTFANLTTNVTGTLPIANGGTGTTSTTFANLTTNVTGTLPVANGGTSLTTLTANNVLLGNGTSAPSFVAPSTSGNVLTSNGTTWTSATPAPGGTADFVAFGSITAGQTVGLRSDGTVEAVFSVVQAEGNGAETAAAASTSSEYLASVYDPDTSQVICVYQNGAASNTVNAVVGSVSGTTITFGAAQVISATASSNYPSATYDTVNQKLVVAYSLGGSTDDGYAVVCSVSGTTITTGTPVLFSSGQVQFTSACFDPVNAKVVIVYRDGADTDNGKAVVGTVSGTSISFGTIVNFDTGVVNVPQIVYEPTSGKVVIAYDNNSGFAIVGTISGTSISFGTAFEFEGNDVPFLSLAPIGDSKLLVAYAKYTTSGEGVVLTVSGTSISGGSAVTFNSGNTGKISVVYNPIAQIATVFFIDTANTTDGTFVTATISGTVPTFSAEVDFDTGVVNWLSAVYDPSSYKKVIFYADSAASGALRANVYADAINYTNASSFIGLSTETVANGATTTVTVLGGVNESQSGLTTGTAYWLAANGSFSTSRTVYAFVGLAKSASSLLLGVGETIGQEWQFLASVSASASSSISFDGFITSQYKSYKLVFDEIIFSTASYPKIRAFVSNSEITTSTYGYLGYRGRGATITNTNSTGADHWTMGTEIFDHSWTADFVITGIPSGKKPVARWNYGTGTSTSDAGFGIMGGILNNTGVVTGLKVFPNTGTITSGTIKLYGLV